MKKEYELLERFRTDRLVVSPSVQNSQKSSFKKWSPLEIIGCVLSVSLIMYGSYNLIFPPNKLQSIQQVQWEADISKQKNIAHSNQRQKSTPQVDQKNEIDEKIEPKTKEEQTTEDQKTVLNTGEEKISLKKLASINTDQSNQQETSSQLQERERQPQTTTVSNQQQNPTTTQRTSPQSNSTVGTQTNTQQTNQSSTQPRRRSSNTTYRYQPPEREYNTYNTYQPPEQEYNTYNSNYTYQSYDSDPSPNLVSIQPSPDTSNNPGMIDGSP